MLGGSIRAAQDRTGPAEPGRARPSVGRVDPDPGRWWSALWQYTPLLHGDALPPVRQRAPLQDHEMIRTREAIEFPVSILHVAAGVSAGAPPAQRATRRTRCHRRAGARRCPCMPAGGATVDHRGRRATRPPPQAGPRPPDPPSPSWAGPGPRWPARSLPGPGPPGGSGGRCCAAGWGGTLPCPARLGRMPHMFVLSCFFALSQQV